MKNEREIAPGLFIAGQPTEDELKHLHGTFRTVINLREADEEGVLTDEERLVEGAGVNYAAIPTSPQIINDASVMRFIQAVDSTDAQPVVAHCGSGGRAGLMMLLYMAIHNSWTVAQALEEGEKLGVAPGPQSKYRAFFEDYIRRHSPAERSV